MQLLFLHVSFARKEVRNVGFCFFFFYLMYVFSGAALGLPTESDFSVNLCIFGI